MLAHGGHLWVEDRFGGGAVFRFMLPARSLAARPNTRRAVFPKFVTTVLEPEAS